MPDLNNDAECFPLHNFYDAVTWRPPLSPNWSQRVKPLRKRTTFCLEGYPVCGNALKKRNSANIPKTLVCHDMKGGYLNDRLVAGHKNLEDYKFVSWPGIDIFVYFSHKFLSIPPLAWINAGHLHGVKVLGTIITEGVEGMIAWKEICASRRLIYVLATNCAQICKYYGFDGYLLNIENPISSSHIHGPFMFFINTLYSALKSINSENQLIWYDAVTIEGQLRWQDCLNDSNGIFFKACDGIFLNYMWNEDSLQASRTFAGDRKYDVYVGIDVFGRGVFGGGGFSTDVALEVIRKYDLSAAIFAPGWVHEARGELERAEIRDFTFWSLLSRFLYTHGPSELPFETSFCRGYGHKYFKKGSVVSDSPWFDQSKMCYLPAQLCGVHQLNNDCCFSYFEEDSFSGGGSLLISQNLNKNKEDHTDCLLSCDFSTDPDKKIGINVYSKPLSESSRCELTLILKTGLDGVAMDDSLRIHTYSITHNVENKVNAWCRSKFVLSLGEEHLYNVSCRLSGDCSPVLIGLIRISAD